VDVVALLRRYGIQPSKGLGQNFLTDEGVLARILEASDLQPTDSVLEVGPGLGLLTRRIAERVAQVVAVELDRKMVALLAQELRGCTNVHVIQGDILQVDPATEITTALADTPANPYSLAPCEEALRYKVIANLPYYITSSALRHLLGARVPPTQLTLMVQREVAERILAGPGDLSLLAISVQVYGEAEMVCRVPARAFYPSPKVDSAVLRIKVHATPRILDAEMQRFFRVVHAGFGQKRKQVHNSLTHGLGLSHEKVLQGLAETNIEADRRPQTLSIEEWARLAQALSSS
jgi:16S rRNA (adenine1518-N6/adenine1519-N6)-dimethyltransferase